MKFLMGWVGLIGLGLGMVVGVQAHAFESFQTEHARFTMITPGLVRMEYDPEGKFTDDPSLFAVNRLPGEALESQSDGKFAAFKSGILSVLYVDDGKPFHDGNLSVQILGVGEWRPGMTNSANLGGTLHSLDVVKSAKPLGQGLLSRDGWFLIDDSARPLLVGGTPAQAPWVAARTRSNALDWYLFGYGQDYRSALQSLTTVGGPVPMPRKYALGTWYSRWWKYSSNDYRQIVNEFHQHDFPLDVLVWDMYWHKPGWTGFSFDRGLLPDAENLLAWLHSQRIAVPLNDHPGDGVGPQEDMYADFMKAMGQDPSSGKTITYDAGDRKYMETLFRLAHSAREKDGVDFWWLDWMGSENKPMDRIDWLNELYWRQSEAHGKRGMSFSRWADWGDHRHPIHFSGDVVIGWPMLQFEVPFTSTAGNVGAFFWSHDVGGFMDDFGGVKARRDTELYARWLQFGALSPVLRMHSTESPFLDKRPWKWGDQVEHVAHTMFHLRAELMPYLYSSAWQSHSESVPFVRAMYFDHPSEDAAYWQPQEYELGDAFVVSPVTAPGSGSGKVGSQVAWLPSGQPWFHWFTGERFEGGYYGLVSSDLNELPLFAKGGTPILMQPYVERPTTEPLATLRIRAFPGAQGATNRATLYEDDGITPAYLQGERATTDVAYTQAAQGRAVIDIYPTDGTYQGQLPERSYIVELPMTEQATSARIDGQTVAVAYDASTHTNSVELPSRDIRSGVRVEVFAAELSKDAELEIGRDARQRRTLGIGGDRDALLALDGTALLNEGNHVVQAFLGADVTSARLQVRYEIDATGVTNGVLEQECKAGSVCRFVLPPPQAPDNTPTGAKLVRKATLSVVAGGKSHRLERTLDQAPTYLRNWSVTAAYGYDPEKDISVQRYAPEKQDHPADSGQWRSVQVQPDNSVDLGAVNGFVTAIAYGVTCISTDRDQPMTLRLNSDDGVEVYLDGTKLFSKNVFRDLTADPDVLLTLLTSGEHQLLFKVANRAGGWGFRSQIETSSPVDAHTCAAVR